MSNLFSYEEIHNHDSNPTKTVSWTRNFANYPFQTTSAYARMMADLARQRRNMELARQQADIQSKLAEAQRDAKNKLETTNRIADAQTAAHRFKQYRFNEVWSALGDGGRNTTGFLGDIIKELNSPKDVELPEFNLNRIYSPGDIQQMVNAKQADISARSAERMQQISDQMGGRGIGSSSPSVLARKMGALASSIAEGTEADRSLRIEKAIENENFLNKALQAAERQYSGLQQNNIRRDRNRINIIGSLGSFIG